MVVEVKELVYVLVSVLVSVVVAVVRGEEVGDVVKLDVFEDVLLVVSVVVAVEVALDVAVDVAVVVIELVSVVLAVNVGEVVTVIVGVVVGVMVTVVEGLVVGLVDSDVLVVIVVDRVEVTVVVQPRARPTAASAIATLSADAVSSQVALVKTPVAEQSRLMRGFELARLFDKLICATRASALTEHPVFSNNGYCPFNVKSAQPKFGIERKEHMLASMLR